MDGTPSIAARRPLSREEKKLKAKVQVFLKPGVLDVQGKAVEAALHGLGWADVKNVRVGRTIEFDVADGDAAKAEAEVKAMCDKLLANTVIESYRVEIA
jgi:phosphoribosylformylglycinamidine synthase